MNTNCLQRQEMKQELNDTCTACDYAMCKVHAPRTEEEIVELRELQDEVGSEPDCVCLSGYPCPFGDDIE